MLNIDSQKKLPLPARALATLFVGVVFALLAIFLPPEDANAGNTVGGGYVFPLPGPHTYGDGFGAGRGHDGQDLFANCGSKLVAANAGRIQRSERDGSGYGNMVVLDVKGARVDLLYAHLRTRTVKVGERVRDGEKVGEVGQTGNASGCHLHFEMHKGDFWNGGHAMRSVTDYLKKWDRRS
jgi:murein DD-endopeptidase MepM/ murein hydrolase activator NlpD